MTSGEAGAVCFRSTRAAVRSCHRNPRKQTACSRSTKAGVRPC